MKLKWIDIEKEEPRHGQHILAVANKMIISGFYRKKDMHMIKCDDLYFQIMEWIPIEYFEEIFEVEE